MRRAAGDLVVRLFAGPGPDGVDGTVTQDDLAGIGKAVVSTPDVRIVPDPSTVEGVAKLRARLATEMKALLSRRLRAEGRVTFDETLVEARDALTEPRIGAGARDLLRRRYSIALVDEAQDTDPIQWQILRAVFDESRLVVIGDPKQSIYAFRGADIESYLSAADRAATHRTLETNWRSDGPLVAAIDTMLAGSTFGDDRIGHRPVRPAGRNRHSRISGTGPPLEIRRISDDFPLRRYQYKPFFYVGDARSAVAADLASETVRLLTSGVRIDDGPALGRSDRATSPCCAAPAGRWRRSGNNSWPGMCRRWWPEPEACSTPTRPSSGVVSSWRWSDPAAPVTCGWRPRPSCTA